MIAAIYLMSSRELIPQARHGSKNTPVNLSVSSKPNVRSGRHMAGFVILNTTRFYQLANLDTSSVAALLTNRQNERRVRALLLAIGKTKEECGHFS